MGAREAGGRGTARTLRWGMVCLAVTIAAATGVPGAGAAGGDGQRDEPVPAGAATLENATWHGIAGEKNGARWSRLPCIDDGTSGKRIEVIYAYPSGSADRIGMFRAPIQQLVSNINREFVASAGETKGRRQLRVVTDKKCRAVVHSVGLGAGTTTDHGSVSDDLKSKGFKKQSRLYLVYLDGDVSTGGQAACGVTGGSPAFAINSDSCWADVDDHELLHGLGSVWGLAPHGTSDGHCSDGADPLCGPYSFPPMTFPCPHWHHDLPDCAHDDYFHTKPKAGTYLANYPIANTANSPFLDSSAPQLNDKFAKALPVGIGIVWGANVGATVEAGEPATAGSAPAHSVWFKITTPAGKDLRVETSASSVDTVLGVYTGTAVNGLTPVAVNDDASGTVRYSRVEIPTAATTYYIRVDGKGGKVGSIRLNVLLGDDNLPTITGLTPQQGNVGQVHIDSSNLFTAGPNGAMITFDGFGVASYDSSDGTGRFVTARNVQWPGPVTFSNDVGYTMSDVSYRITPDIVSFSPGSGSVGSQVHVKGTGFAGKTVPKFTVNGVNAQVVDLDWDGGLVGFDATIVVPTGASDGKIAVQTAIGSDQSAANFDVT